MINVLMVVIVMMWSHVIACTVTDRIGDLHYRKALLLTRWATVCIIGYVIGLSLTDHLII